MGDNGRRWRVVALIARCERNHRGVANMNDLTEKEKELFENAVIVVTSALTAGLIIFLTYLAQ